MFKCTKALHTVTGDTLEESYIHFDTIITAGARWMVCQLYVFKNANDIFNNIVPVVITAWDLPQTTFRFPIPEGAAPNLTYEQVHLTLRAAIGALPEWNENDLIIQ